MRDLRPEGVRYRIEKCIGQGHSTTVYRAIREDSAGHSRHRVALKILKTESAVSWLRREFDALTRVNSPHCVRVLGWENLPEGSALVLDWVDGLSLFDLGRQVNLDDELCTELVAQIQAGLRELDRCGIFHGDLSPSNVLVDRMGCVRLIDFACDPTETTDRRGTPAYLAPEIWNGGTGSLAADLFALGLIEEDLRTSFDWVPATIESARYRAFATSRPRGFREIESCLEMRKRLAVEVDRILNERTRLTGMTRSLNDTNAFQVTKRRTAASLAFSLIIMTAPGNARAPLSDETARGDRAVLVIRTQRWMEIRVNGRDLGFAPLEIRGLKPGTHRIQWKSSGAAGETRLALSSGQRRSISERDLVLSPPSR